MAEPHLKTAGQPQAFQRAGVTDAGAISVAEEVTTLFKDLKIKRKYKYIVLKIEDNVVTCAETVGPDDGNLQKMLDGLPDSDCRYVVYDHDAKTADGRQTSKVYFISWLPVNSTPPLKMAYTTGKNAVRACCPGVTDINANSRTDVREGLGVEEEEEEDDSGSDFE